MPKGPCATLLLVILVASAGEAAADHEVDGIRHELILDGTEGAANVVVGPGGTLYYAEVYAGDVYALPPGATEPEKLFHIDVMQPGESGLTGLELAPDFETSGAFYVYYVAPVDSLEHGENRLARIVPGGEPEVLLTVPAGEYHNGGRLAWGPDGHLFIGTGENNQYEVARDPDDLRGKVLRVTADGAPAAGNPFDNEVYSLGHRNVYGVVYDATLDQVVITENGDVTADELNVLVAGADFGWPGCEGPCDAEWGEGYEDPVVSWSPSTAPTGIEMLGGAYWVGMFNTGHIHRIVPPDDADGDWRDEVVYDAGKGILDVAVGLDGKTLYYAAWSSIHELTLPEGLLEGEPAEPIDPTQPGTPPTDPGLPGDADDGEDADDAHEAVNGSREAGEVGASGVPGVGLPVVLLAGLGVARALRGRARR